MRSKILTRAAFLRGVERTTGLTGVHPVDLEINGEVEPTVNARDLHGLLEVGRDFSTWIKDRIRQCGFREGKDYVVVENLSSPNSGSSENARKQPKNTGPQKRGAVKRDTSGLISGANRTDYFLSLHSAYSICMMQGNDIGQRWRDFFLRAYEELQDLRFSNAAYAVFLLDNPREWERLFPEAFFEHLSRLYCRQYNGMKSTPAFFGHFINKYVYDYVWRGLPSELKGRRNEFHGEDETTLIKMHQFLAEHSREVVQRRILDVISQMKFCHTIDDFKRGVELERELESQRQLPLRK